MEVSGLYSMVSLSMVSGQGHVTSCRPRHMTTPDPHGAFAAD